MESNEKKRACTLTLLFLKSMNEMVRLRRRQRQRLHILLYLLDVYILRARKYSRV